MMLPYCLKFVIQFSFFLYPHFSRSITIYQSYSFMCKLNTTTVQYRNSIIHRKHITSLVKVYFKDRLCVLFSKVYDSPLVSNAKKAVLKYLIFGKYLCILVSL